MAALLFPAATVFGVLGAWSYPPVQHFASVMGFRPFADTADTANIHGADLQIIPGTAACEDLEYHAPSGMLYTACIGDVETARQWTPGAEALSWPEKSVFGSLVIIDPKTLKQQKLSFENFEGPFSTHGIALYTPPSQSDLVYIYAVNHLPNPRWEAGSKTEEKAASQIELFTHKVGTSTVHHVRSIKHPLIHTPNDLLAISESEFLVTNDHYYHDGPMRFVEEIVRGFDFIPGLGSWTNTIHVRFDQKNIDAIVALDTVATNNGLGWGPDRQVIIGDAVGGNVYFANLPTEENNRTISISHYIPIDAVVDNAAYFTDPYASSSGKDYSGYLMPGLYNAMNFLSSFSDPALKAPIPGVVWYLPAIAGKHSSGGEEKTKEELESYKSMRKLIFKDDGHTIRSVTTAAIVAIDPATNGGKREGWLFATSVIGANTVATKIDFEKVLV